MEDADSQPLNQNIFIDKFAKTLRLLQCFFVFFFWCLGTITASFSAPAKGDRAIYFNLGNGAAM